MKNFMNFDKAVAILAIPAAILLMVVEYNAPRPTVPQAVGPHVWPIGLLGLLIVSAIVLFFETDRGRRGREPSSGAPSATQTAIKWYKKPKMAPFYFIAGLLLYAILFNTLGFILSTFFLIVYQARILQAGKWLRNIAIAAFFSMGVYSLFAKLLSVSLPVGLLGW